MLHEVRSCMAPQTEETDLFYSCLLAQLLASGLVAQCGLVQVYNLVPDVSVQHSEIKIEKLNFYGEISGTCPG